MQIFAFTKCPDFRALLEVECRNLFGVGPVIQDSLGELSSMLELFPSIDLLILDAEEKMFEDHELRTFLDNLPSKVKETLVLGSKSWAEGTVRWFKRSDVSHCFEVLRSRGGAVDPSASGWGSVPVVTLTHFSSVPFDLFIKLSDQRYVKRILAHEEIDGGTIQTLQQKGLTEIYFEKKHSRDLSMMLINNMINKIEKNYGSYSEQLRAHQEVFETTKEIIQTLGLSGRVIEVCETTIDKMWGDVHGSSKEVSAYLTALMNDKNLSFHFKLINLSNYIGTQLIVEMQMPDLEQEMKKFIYASFFSDMTLKKDVLHFIRKDTDGPNLNLQERNEVNFHALKASELVSGAMKDLPKEVALIIRQHHGSFSGIGFPTEKSPNLLPLSKILVVAQDLAFTILTHSDTPALKILKIYLKKHKFSGLTQLVEIMEQSFKDKLEEKPA